MSFIIDYPKYGWENHSDTSESITARGPKQQAAAIQFRSPVGSEGLTRVLENQWHGLQKELTQKVAMGMDDSAIVSSIDWGRYQTLMNYGINLKKRTAPMLTRPVSFTQDNLYGVLTVLRRGSKAMQTGGEYALESKDKNVAFAKDDAKDGPYTSKADSASPSHNYAGHKNQWETLKIHVQDPDVNMATPYGSSMVDRIP